MTKSALKTPRLRIRLKTAAETCVRAGHPWVFDQSIREQNRPGTAGEIAAIFDRNDKFLAAGLYDPDSPIRVRVLQCNKPVPINETFLRERLNASLARRAGLLSSKQTTGLRLVYGESDGLPGMVLDRYGSTAVLKVYTSAWWPWLSPVQNMIREALPEITTLVLRWSRNVAAPNFPADHVHPYRVLFQRDTSVEEGTPVVFLENGLRFEADIWRGQKTGFFLDQRENRAKVGGFSRDATVLNAFSFSGGFSLYAAQGGARSVTDVDISQHALESSRRNFALNASVPGVATTRHLEVQAEAFEWLEKCTDKFSMVILDPPALARREVDRVKGIEAYERLAQLGARRLQRGGVLLAASCSAHVGKDEFFAAVRLALHRERLAFQELAVTGLPSDHAATFAEAEYLKAIYLKVL